MAGNGVKTTDFETRLVVDALLGNATQDNILDTVSVPVSALAVQLMQEAPLKALGANAGLYATRTILNADLTRTEPFMGWVYADPVAANNGIYRLVDGAPDLWAWAAPLPFNFIRMIAGGTPNAISATSMLPLPPQAYGGIGLLPILATNTGAVTLVVNDAPPKPLQSVVGAALGEGNLVAGMLLPFLDVGSEYRLLSDFSSHASQAAAETARVLTEQARTETVIAKEQTFTARDETLAAKIATIAAAEANGSIVFFDTKAEAIAAVLDENQVIRIFADESHDGAQAFYRLEGEELKPKLVLYDNIPPPRLNSAAGDRMVYDRGLFVVGGENSSPNPDFLANPAGVVVLPAAPSGSGASGSIQSWFGVDMPTSGASFEQTQIELVDIAGKRFLKLDQSQPDTTPGVQGRVRVTIPIRPDQIGRPLEISFLAAGYLPDTIQFSNWGQPMRADIGLTPRRLSYIVPGEYVTSTNHTLNFQRNEIKADGKYALIGEVMVADAVARPWGSDLALPARGVNVQLNRAGGPPSVARLKSYLQRIKQMGGLARVSLSVDGNTFSNFDGNTPPRWTSLKDGGAQLAAADAFMSLAAQYGVEVIPTIIQSPSQGSSWHNCNNSSSGFLDNAAVAASYVNAVTAVVNRYKSYPNIVAWDIVNEGFDDNKVNATIAATGNGRLGYAAFESFYKAAYAAVKAADPNARVILTGGFSDVLNGYEALLLDPATQMCDLVGYSLYISNLTFSTKTSAPAPRDVNVTTGQFASPPLLTQAGLAEGARLYIAAGDSYVTDGASIGTALAFNTIYYAKDVDSAAGTFYLSAAPGGPRIAPLTGMSSGSGSKNFLIESADGALIAAGQNLVRNAIISQRYPYIASEIGASGRGTVFGTLPYRIPAINAAHIRAYADVLPSLGFSTQIAWDEYPNYEMLTAGDGTSLNEAGRALANSQSRSGRRWGLSDLVAQMYAPIRRARTALFVGMPRVSVDGDGLLAIARKAVFGHQTGGATNANLQIDSSSDAQISISGFSGAAVRRVRAFFDVANQALRFSGTNVALHASADGGIGAGTARVETDVSGVRISGDADVGDGSTAVRGALLKGIYVATSSLSAIGLSGALASGQTTATSTIAVPGANLGALVDVFLPNHTMPSGVRFQGRCTAKGVVTLYVDADAGLSLGNQSVSIRATNV